MAQCDQNEPLPRKFPAGWYHHNGCCHAHHIKRPLRSRCQFSGPPEKNNQQHSNNASPAERKYVGRFSSIAELKLASTDSKHTADCWISIDLFLTGAIAADAKHKLPLLIWRSAKSDMLLDVSRPRKKKRFSAGGVAYPFAHWWHLFLLGSPGQSKKFFCT